LNELVEAVKRHAEANYDRGWDVIVECYTDEEIAEVIGRSRKLPAILRKFLQIVDLRQERLQEARAESGEYFEY